MLRILFTIIIVTVLVGGGTWGTICARRQGMSGRDIAVRNAFLAVVGYASLLPLWG